MARRGEGANGTGGDRDLRLGLARRGGAVLGEGINDSKAAEETQSPFFIDWH